MKNWVFYYPVEWVLAHWTDILITINREDHALAQKHMHAGRVEYIPGVGIDLDRFTLNTISRKEKEIKRGELGVADGEKMLLSIGELSARKNHEVVIRALAKINDPKFKYYICGQGVLEEKLRSLINALGLSEAVKLLGFRNDISDLCQCADLFIFPSLQEGLPIALMEAIASRAPVICSNIRGNNDLAPENAMFSAKNVDEVADKISEYISEDKTAEAEQNYSRLAGFSDQVVIAEMKRLYSSFGGS